MSLFTAIINWLAPLGFEDRTGFHLCNPTSSHPQQGDADVRGEGGGGSIHEGSNRA